MNIAELTIQLMYFRAQAAEWFFDELHIIQGVRGLIKTKIHPEDQPLALNLIPMITNRQNGV
jgi:hypothetical protein